MPTVLDVFLVTALMLLGFAYWMAVPAEWGVPASVAAALANSLAVPSPGRGDRG